MENIKESFDTMVRPMLGHLASLPAVLFLMIATHCAAQNQSTAALKDTSVSPQDAEVPTTAQMVPAEFQSAAEMFEKAFNEADANGVSSLWVADGEYVDGTGAVFNGRNEIEKAYAQFFADNKEAKLTINIESVKQLNDATAIEEGTTLVEVPPASAALGRYLAVHVKENGKWLLASVRDQVIDTAEAQQNLADLDWLIGTWVAEEHGNENRSVCRWVSDGKFVQRSFTTTLFNGSTTSGVQLIGWNPIGGHVQSWTFSPDGGHDIGIWVPTDQGWEASMHGTTGDGVTTSSINLLRRLDANAYVWQSINRTLGGITIADTDEVVIKRQPTSK